MLKFEELNIGRHRRQIYWVINFIIKL